MRRLHGLSAARSSSNAADADGLQVSETVLIDQEAEGANARYIAINVIHVSPCTRYIGFTRVCVCVSLRSVWRQRAC